MEHPIRDIGEHLVLEINRDWLHHGIPPLHSMIIHLQYKKCISDIHTCTNTIGLTMFDQYFQSGWVGTVEVNKFNDPAHYRSYQYNTEVVGTCTGTHIYRTTGTKRCNIVITDEDHPELIEYAKQQHGERVVTALITSTKAPIMDTYTCAYQYRGPETSYLTAITYSNTKGKSNA